MSAVIPLRHPATTGSFGSLVAEVICSHQISNLCLTVHSMQDSKLKIVSVCKSGTGGLLLPALSAPQGMLCRVFLSLPPSHWDEPRPILPRAHRCYQALERATGEFQHARPKHSGHSMWNQRVPPAWPSQSFLTHWYDALKHLKGRSAKLYFQISSISMKDLPWSTPTPYFRKVFVGRFAWGMRCKPDFSICCNSLPHYRQLKSVRSNFYFTWSF